jgi:hypothetical protein
LQGDSKCIFCGVKETVNHLFVQCNMVLCIWSWICRYNNCRFACKSIDDLWYLDVLFPYKNFKVCEVVRGTVLWTMWKERNRLIFEGVFIKLQGGSNIIYLAKYWSLSQGEEFQTNLQLILPTDIILLSVQVLESNLHLVPVGDEVWSGEELDR